MGAKRTALAQSVAAALAAYVAAGSLEAAVVSWMRPTEWELAWLSDLVLAALLALAVYFWRHLVMTRTELAEQQRSELVLQTQLSLAADIQRRLLPTLPPASSGLDCAAVLRPAGRIGGDFYDFVETSAGRWVVFIGDVSGKGIPAALALGTLRSRFRTLAHQGLAPADIVTHLSAALREEWSGAPYVTCIVAAFDLRAGNVCYTNAGHPAGLVLSESVRHLDKGGPPVGLLTDQTYGQECLTLRQGDTLVLLTDGVTEALDEPVVEVLARLQPATQTAAELCREVIARALEGPGPSGDPDWDDDRTVVIVSVRDLRR
jgi:serine phosphatase RsbU (regulator of sigma subunit)